MNKFNYLTSYYPTDPTDLDNNLSDDNLYLTYPLIDCAIETCTEQPCAESVMSKISVEEKGEQLGPN